MSSEAFLVDFTGTAMPSRGTPADEMPDTDGFRAATVQVINAHTHRDPDLLRHAADEMLRHATAVADGGGGIFAQLRAPNIEEAKLGPVQAIANLAFAEAGDWPTTAGGWRDFCDRALDAMPQVRVVLALTRPEHDAKADDAEDVIRTLRASVDGLDPANDDLFGFTFPLDTVVKLVHLGAVADASHLTEAVLPHSDLRVITHLVTTCDRDLDLTGLGAALCNKFVDDTTDDHYLLTTATRQYRIAGKAAKATELGRRALGQRPSKPWYAANALAAAARDAGHKTLSERAWSLGTWSNPREEFFGDLPAPVAATAERQRADAFIDWVLSA